MHARSILENIDPERDYKYFVYAYDENDPIVQHSIDITVPYTLIHTKTLKKSIDSPRDFIHLSRVIFHRFAALKNREINIFIQFDFTLGLPRHKSIKKNILVAYDLIPLIFKNDYIPTPVYEFRRHRGILRKCKKAIRAAYYQLRYKLHYKNFHRADLLLSISQNTTQSLKTMLNISPKKIVTIPLAPVFNTDVPQKPSRLTVSKDFIFYIGATDARKRVSDLINAFSEVKERHDIQLVLAGKEFEKVDKIPSDTILEALQSSPYNEDIRTVGYIGDAEKLWLYKNAAMFVFPTLYEGFGLPIVEAMQHGCPVVSYSNSSINEIAGEAVLLAPTGNVDKLAHAINRILDDSNLRQTLTEQGYIQSKSYTWQNYMKQLYSALDAVYDGN